MATNGNGKRYKQAQKLCAAMAMTRSIIQWGWPGRKKTVTERNKAIIPL